MINTDLLPTIPDLNQFAGEVNRLAHEKGWYEGVRPLADQLFLAVGELAEAGEEYRSGHRLRHIYPSGAPELTYDPTLHLHGAKAVKPEGFGVELADCLIRLLDSAKERGIDIDEAVSGAVQVMESNIEHRIETPDRELEIDMLTPLQKALAAFNEDESPLALLLEVTRSITWIAEAIHADPRDLGYPKDLTPISDAERYEEGFGVAIFQLFVVAACTCVDLMACSVLKHGYNQTRPHRHGGKKA